MARSDYTTTSMQLTFPAGSSDGDMSQCVEVTVSDDDALEMNETFTVMLTSAETYVTLSNAQTEVTITDVFRSTATYFQLNMFGVPDCETWRVCSQSIILLANVQCTYRLMDHLLRMVTWCLL